MSKQEHRVKVGRYTFIAPNDPDDIRVDRDGEPWIAWMKAPDATRAMMQQLDAARVVVQAARDAVDAPTLRRKEFLQEALAVHDRLTSDREPPSAWCGVSAEKPDASDPAASDPPIGLDDLERRATRDAQRLDGLHGDPSRAGGWIGHRDYARALVLLIPRLRKAEAGPRAGDPSIAYWKEGTRLIEECLTKAQRADPGDVPFPLVGDEAKLWHSAQATAYQHALEMMGWTESIATPTAGAANATAERDRAMFRAFVAIETAPTIEDLNGMRAEIDDARLGPADRAEVKRVYERRKAWLENPL